jgi:hypothetical protein
LAPLISVSEAFFAIMGISFAPIPIFEREPDAFATNHAAYLLNGPAN